MCITLIFVKTGIAEKASLPLKRVTGKLNFPPAAAACFFLSVCSGYPAGSKVVSEFYSGGAFTKKESGKIKTRSLLSFSLRYILLKSTPENHNGSI